MEPLYRTIHPQCRAIGAGLKSGGEPLIEFVASDETVDRYDEVIKADGWRLENYLRNPVFQNSHQYGDILYTVGKAVRVQIQGSKLVIRVLFAVDTNPVAKIAYGLYRDGFLNAVSVGFHPIRIESAPLDASGRPLTPWLRRYLEQELLELSAVCIPANPNALQTGVTAPSDELESLHTLLRTLERRPASRENPPLRLLRILSNLANRS